MRLLFSVTHTDKPGNDLHSTLAAALNQRGHQVDCLQFAKNPQWQPLNPDTKWTSRSVDGVLDNFDIHFNITTNGRWFFNWILYKRWRRITRKYIKENEYDAVISANICVTPATLAAIDTGIPSIILTTGPAAIRYDPASDKLDKTPVFKHLPMSAKVQYPFIRLVHQLNVEAFTNATDVVAMSDFDAAVTRETFGRTPSKTYIPVKLSNFKVSDWSPSKITLVNPRTKHKGLDIFLEIARRLPQEQFQIAGGIYDQSKIREINQLDNVHYLGYRDDMRDVYRNTKLLLVPSTYQEGGNRVIPEAGVNGIPVVGSDLGGIPDYIGSGGDTVSEYKCVDAWLAAIERYLTDPEYYRRKSTNAKEESTRFEFSHIIDLHENRLQTLLS